MYEEYFGLKANPFGMTPNPAFLFLTDVHREALAALTYAVLGRKGFLVLTGEAGTGKTTLLMKLMESISPGRASFSLILNPLLSPSELLEGILLDVGYGDIPASKPQRLRLLQDHLFACERSNKTAVLIIDEAHKLSEEALEEIRLLTNFETADRKLLQIILAGQPELRATLNRPHLSQLKQRVAVRVELHPLSAKQIDHYIRFRWVRAMTRFGSPFTQEAIAAISAGSQGIPRLVNAICDAALLLACGERAQTISAAHVMEVLRDLDISRSVPVGIQKGALEKPNTKPEDDARKLNVPSPVSAGDVLRLPTLDRYMPNKGSRSVRIAQWFGFRTVSVPRSE